MEITILGSGTSTGVPVIGCHCAVCASPDPRNKRYRASIFVTTDIGRKFVVDTGPEFRLQLLREGISSIDAVFYTHLHADHCHGFDDLRALYFHSQTMIPCYLSLNDASEFRKRFSYVFENTGYRGTKPQVELKTFEPGREFDVFEQKVETISLAHGVEQTSAYRFGDFLYATDFKEFSKQQIENWRGKIRVMVASGIHFGEHATHSVIPETLKLFEALGVERGYITHLSHEVDYLRDSINLPSHVEFAYDGMKIDLS